MDQATQEGYEEKLRKLRRKLKRHVRDAHSQGFMLGAAAMLRPGDVVIDCGANVGDVTAELAATGATVHCFEPDPYAFSMLHNRFAETPNVTMHNKAVGIEAGTIGLMRSASFDDDPKGNSVMSTTLPGGRGMSAEADGVIDVEVIDFPAFLDGLIKEHGDIAMLKMDIEGAELDIIEVMDQRALFDPIRVTLVETHERKFPNLRPRFRALKSRVAEKYSTSKVNLDWI
ncbi:MULTISPECIES: FkbM family methyltransferase [Roseobacteraceae]|jgi:FkbM family methyltransferase|uniref:31-O-demethyl-FK506 methyltransferase FkbM n=1 Tax=Falsiruegeria mediterranea M17 TaxID=1200281 RepID=A0A2R8C4V3_9RHOB|nr:MULTISPECIES: FkbM family methyltransferase [Roseobacteraceae]MBO9450090.1 FkbM family methyltransferase [Tropicibacter sp. R16_0]SPJ27460.1 31-O-demethyl-FK506 methyltransferase FkbM [Falsiruegeria mediterranea M17]